MNDDKTLVEALRAAGHEDVAKHLRDRQLAAELREAGHATLADQLEGKPAEQEQVEQKPEREPTLREADTEAIVHALKRDAGIDLKGAA